MQSEFVTSTVKGSPQRQEPWPLECVRTMDAAPRTTVSLITLQRGWTHGMHLIAILPSCSRCGMCDRLYSVFSSRECSYGELRVCTTSISVVGSQRRIGLRFCGRFRLLLAEWGSLEYSSAASGLKSLWVRSRNNRYRVRRIYCRQTSPRHLVQCRSGGWLSVYCLRVQLER